eukprot:837464-Amphidinium_carterae.1
MENSSWQETGPSGVTMAWAQRNAFLFKHSHSVHQLQVEEDPPRQTHCFAIVLFNLCIESRYESLESDTVWVPIPQQCDLTEGELNLITSSIYPPLLITLAQTCLRWLEQRTGAATKESTSAY